MSRAAICLRPLGCGLPFLGHGWVLRDQREAEYPGERPELCPGCQSSGPIHGHGFYSRILWTLEHLVPVKLRVWLHRWQCQLCGSTTHSPPPDLIPHTKACTSVVSFVLTLSLIVGRERCLEYVPGQSESLIETRTVARWFARALVRANETEQFIRSAVIEASEPRPMERLFRGGVSPPPKVIARRWRSPALVSSLWKGLTMLFVAAVGLDVPPCSLLAWARGRADALGQPFLI